MRRWGRERGKFEEQEKTRREIIILGREEVRAERNEE